MEGCTLHTSHRALPMRPTSGGEAISLQELLRTRLSLTDDFGKLERVAGLDVGFIDAGTTARAAVVVLSFPALELIDYARAYAAVDFPYIPGLLAFRELPSILKALDQLHQSPDLLICDGHGIAHPRRLGIAAHLGLLTNLPTIGCAKSLLIGSHAPLAEERGARTALIDRGEQIGWVVRTRRGVRPVYVSPGHRVSMASAVDIVLACTTRYRLPETTRYAHTLASSG